MAVGNGGTLRKRATRMNPAATVRREMTHEEHVLEHLTAPTPRERIALALDSGRGRTARTVLVFVLGLYAVWSPMLDVPTWMVWTTYAGALALAATTVTTLRRRVILPFLLFGAVWAAFWVMHPVWSTWDQTHSRTVQEAFALRSAALSSTAFALLIGPSEFGAHLVRRVWAVLLAGVVVMGYGEVLTGRHFSPFSPYGPPAHSPSGPFGNPNNLACVLVVGIGLTLGRVSERLSRLHRVLLTVAVVLQVVLVVLTFSRSALLAVVVVAAGAVILALARSTRWRHLIPGRWTWTGLTVLGTTLLLPKPGTSQPLWRSLLAQDAAQAEADTLRTTLVRSALLKWQQSPWTGIGGGRLDILFRHERGIRRQIPVHNTFVELLAEYGIIGAAPVALLLAVAVITVLRARDPRGAAFGRPHHLDVAGTRYVAFVFLVGIVLAALVMSSSLHWQPWWLMFASLTVITARLGTGRSVS